MPVRYASLILPWTIVVVAPVECTADFVHNSVKFPDWSPHSVGDSVTYTCDTGYFLSGGNQTRTCSSSGNWTGSTPTCSKSTTVVTCIPDAVSHSEKTPDQATYDYNTAVLYLCNAGYDHMRGDLNRTCKADATWTGTAPICTRSLEPVCFPNGTVIVNNPDVDEFISAHASNMYNMYYMCYIEWIASADNTQPNEALEITGCDLNYAVIVVFSPMEEVDERQGGNGLLAYVIQCSQIDATGVASEITLVLQPSLTTNAVHSVSPTFTIVSNFRYTSATGPIQTAVTVGDELYWTIDIPGWKVMPNTSIQSVSSRRPLFASVSTVDTNATGLLWIYETRVLPLKHQFV